MVEKNIIKYITLLAFVNLYFTNITYANNGIED